MIRTEEFAPDGALLRTNMLHLELAYLYPRHRSAETVTMDQRPDRPPPIDRRPSTIDQE
jgi:hypothetical protein